VEYRGIFPIRLREVKKNLMWRGEAWQLGRASATDYLEESARTAAMKTKLCNAARFQDSFQRIVAATDRAIATNGSGQTAWNAWFLECVVFSWKRRGRSSGPFYDPNCLLNDCRWIFV
jgi:hypothetical protein